MNQNINTLTLENTKRESHKNLSRTCPNHISQEKKNTNIFSSKKIKPIKKTIVIQILIAMPIIIMMKIKVVFVDFPLIR